MPVSDLLDLHKVLGGFTVPQWYRNVGIDLGLKSAHEVGVIDPSGKMFRFKCGHTAEDLDGMVARLTRDLPAGGNLRFVMEPTDTAWVPVAWYLMELGYAVYLVSASVVHDFRKAVSKHAKTDRLDAATLASLFVGPMSARALNRVQFGTRTQETLKRLVKRDYRLITGISDRKKRLDEEELRQVRETMHLVYQQIDSDCILMTAPGVGPVVAPAVTAAIGDDSRFPGAKQFRAYTGIVPKVSRSGVTDAKGKGITKAGPNWLKRQLYLAADVARRIDPELAKVYHDQMVKYGHHHTHAVCAVATRFADRLFICYRERRPYELRGLDGSPISPTEARAYIAEHLTVPEEVRKRLRRGTRQTKRKTPASNVRANS